METISACPHHGFDTWMLGNHFYDGMSPTMKQLLETMCGGDFLSKNPEEAMDFLTSKAWDEACIQFKGRHVLTPRRHGIEGEAIYLGWEGGRTGRKKST